MAGRQSKSKWDPTLFEGAPDINIETEDEDADGVFAINDDCPDTPPGVEVDERGCPKDEDGDGVPDYMDDEPGTPTGTLVDDRGRTMTDEMRQRLKIASTRDQLCTKPTISSSAAMKEKAKITRF